MTSLDFTDLQKVRWILLYAYLTGSFSVFDPSSLESQPCRHYSNCVE